MDPRGSVRFKKENTGLDFIRADSFQVSAATWYCVLIGSDKLGQLLF